MKNVRIVVEFGPLKIGQTYLIPDSLYEDLKGFVELLPDGHETTEDQRAKGREKAVGGPQRSG